MSEQLDPTILFSLTVKNTPEALDFYAKAFGAVELFRMETPDGGIGHAEFMIGNSKVFISDASPEWNAYPMEGDTTASCLFSIGTDDCEASYKQAVEAGGQSLMEPADQVWGMKTAMIRDPYGYRWTLRELVEELTPEEMAERFEKLMSGE